MTGSIWGVVLHAINMAVKVGVYLNCLPAIAENNHHKFRIDPGELDQRKQFVKNTTATVEVSH